MPDVDGAVGERSTERSRHDRERDVQRNAVRGSGQSGKARTDIAAHDARLIQDTRPVGSIARKRPRCLVRDQGAQLLWKIAGADGIIATQQLQSYETDAQRNGTAKGLPPVDRRAGGQQVAVKAAEIIVVVPIHRGTLRLDLKDTVPTSLPDGTLHCEWLPAPSQRAVVSTTTRSGLSPPAGSVSVTPTLV